MADEAISGSPGISVVGGSWILAAGSCCETFLPLRLLKLKSQPFQI